MSNTIQIKRSSTAASVPTAGQLAVGELAVNLADRKLYTKNASNAVVELGEAGVDLTTNQTIAGVKTFSSSPVVPNATTSGQAVNKGQVDAAIIAASPTTAQVLTATAGASFGAVGTYVQPYSAPATSLGGTQAGSSLAFLDGSGSPYTGAVGGTWRSMGRGSVGSSQLWLRIS